MWVPTVDRSTMAAFALGSVATVAGVGLAVYATGYAGNFLRSVGGIVTDLRYIADIAGTVAMADHVVYAIQAPSTGFSWDRTFDMVRDVRSTAECAQAVVERAQLTLCDREIPALQQTERIAMQFHPAKLRDAAIAVAFAVLAVLSILLMLFRITAPT
eukprot:m.254826 g.254826  ORF g.254826 m.254826 type:complete len:158 (-) comp19151_c0_seq1:48-521(-)